MSDTLSDEISVTTAPIVDDISPRDDVIPPDEPPDVTVLAITGRVVTGVAMTVGVDAFPGLHFFEGPPGEGVIESGIVDYASLHVRVDGVEVGSRTSSSGVISGRFPFTVTFQGLGDHTIDAFGVTTGGGIIQSASVAVRAAPAGAPTYTLTAPTNGAIVGLSEGGGQVDMALTVPADQYFPLTVAISRDGVTTSEQLNSTQYQRTIPLAPMPLGNRVVSVTVSDRDGFAATQTRTLTGRDIAPPRLDVAFPKPDAQLVGETDGTKTVSMNGTAPDTQSGMAGGSATVSWALTPGGTRIPAVPTTGNDFSNWSASVPLAGFGAHTIHVWATDAAGNTAETAIPVTVVSSFVPATLDERLDEREYLAALLSFAQEQVTVPGAPPAPLDTPTLVAALGQPVDRLSQPLSAAADRGRQEINQLRVPIELLRARIAATSTPTGPGAPGEATYRGTAYDTLLAAAGTSYAELRLARGATPAIRRALADRLGIRLSATTPDELDQLVLDGDRRTEAALETLFGLPSSTGGDPLRAPAVPVLLSLRLNAQALTWAEQDQHPSPPRAFTALLDPDVVGPADVVSGPSSVPIGQLLAQRANGLADYAQLLDGLRTKAANPVAGLAAMVAQALPGTDLAALETRDGQGSDISADLDSVGLTRAGFLYLRKLDRLVATGDLTAAEWADAVAVLTATHKHTLLPGWQTQETAFVLSPDFFLLTVTGPAVNPYRVDSRARTGWQSVLRTRIAQRQDLLGAQAQAVAATEQVALPILRDALLADLAPTTTGNIGEELSARFFVDMLAGGALRTTRIEQAIESVQSLLSAKRSGELAAGHPAFGWTIAKIDVFTRAWAWLGEIGSWQAATMAFLFPERHLDPSLLVPNANADPPVAFDAFFAAIRGTGPFSADQAVQAARTYLTNAKIPLFDYLQNRSTEHQKALQTLNQQTPEPQRREVFWAVPMLLAQRLQSAGDYRAALDWYWIVYPYDVDHFVASYARINTETVFRPDLTFPPNFTAGLDPFALVDLPGKPRPAPYTRYTLLSIIRCHLDFADAEFTRETDESIANARTLYVTARRLLDTPVLQPQQPTNFGEPALPVPELAALRARAEVQLAKLRQGRNIAGMPRAQGVVARSATGQPSPFRFKTLLDRARQLTAQASQMESGYLAALEKYDDRGLRLFDALKGVDLSAAQVTLAASRVQEAGDAVTAAEAQRDKADVMVNTYATLIDAPPNQYESDLLDEYGQLRDVKDGIAVADTAIGILQAAAGAANIFSAITSFGVQQGASGGIIAATAVKGALALEQNSIEAQVQANQLQAGIEQRRADWRVQQTSAQQDSLVAAAQVTTANDQVAIATQERNVATLEHDQALATVQFLNGQFTNADLYLWMSNTLGAVYRYFLQQATATARLAQSQLAFERAESQQALIRNDYWQLPANPSSNAAQVDRRGLTGAEQLAEDIARLDDYAVSSERRRLNLSQTFSLGRLLPVEFLDFRRTGRLVFAIPMALFDQDFPGHYLRMIRQVRTSVVALVPPDRGIRATLTSNGISRVTTVQDGAFGDVVIRHDPTVVALTSPVGASGVFELDAQSDILLPFESSGVDTSWELRLPPAANPFDFASIVDVLLTIDYTALTDDGYRGQLITKLNADRDRGADRVFSLSRDFPDQWYDLNNPADPTNRSVTIPLRDIDFPLGVDGITTAAIAVLLSSNQPVADTVVSLRHGQAGGDATTTDGIASSRRGNAPAWIAITGSDPTGDWQLGFGPAAKPLFDSGQLDDILLAVSWTGQAPLWVA